MAEDLYFFISLVKEFCAIAGKLVMAAKKEALRKKELEEERAQTAYNDLMKEKAEKVLNEKTEELN